MKTIKILLFACFTLLISLGILCYFAYNKMQENNIAVQNTLNISLRKAISTKQVLVAAPIDTGKDIIEMNKKLNEGLFDSINNVLKRGLAKIPKTTQPNLQNVYKTMSNSGLQQLKIDSLERNVHKLSMIILSNQGQPKQVIAEKTTKDELSKQSYYNDVNIIFRTRNSFITGKIKPQYKINLQYGQLFRFENNLPEYVCNFTDKKGNTISDDSAKDFLIKKSFYVNSVELKDNNAIVNCFQGI